MLPVAAITGGQAQSGARRDAGVSVAKDYTAVERTRHGVAGAGPSLRVSWPALDGYDHAAHLSGGEPPERRQVSVSLSGRVDVRGRWFHDRHGSRAHRHHHRYQW